MGSGDRLVTDYEVRAFAAVFGVAFENLIEDEEMNGLPDQNRRADFFCLIIYYRYYIISTRRKVVHNVEGADSRKQALQPEGV